MESDSADAKSERMCNGDNKISEQGVDLDLDLNLKGRGGEGDEEKKASTRRRVRFNDCSLTQVLEFQPSDSSDSDNNSREDAISLCAQLCTWLCGQRPATDA